MQMHKCDGVKSTRLSLTNTQPLSLITTAYHKMYNFILFFAQVKSTSLKACSLIYAYLSIVTVVSVWLSVLTWTHLSDDMFYIFFLSLLGPNLEIRPIYDLKRFQTLRERARVILQKNLTPICSITKNPSKLLSVQAFWLKSSKNGLKNDVELRLNA